MTFGYVSRGAKKWPAVPLAELIMVAIAEMQFILAMYLL